MRKRLKIRHSNLIKQEQHKVKNKQKKIINPIVIIKNICPKYKAMIVKDLGIIKNKSGFYLFKIQGIMSKERESKKRKKI